MEYGQAFNINSRLSYTFNITNLCRFSAVMRPETFIKVGDHHKDYTADIPAPLSQIDEPSEDVFKEAAIAQVAALKSPSTTLNDSTDDNKISNLIKGSSRVVLCLEIRSNFE